MFTEKDPAARAFKQYIYKTKFGSDESQDKQMTLGIGLVRTDVRMIFYCKYSNTSCNTNGKCWNLVLVCLAEWSLSWWNERWINRFPGHVSHVSFSQNINTTCIVSCKCIPAKACAGTESVCVVLLVLFCT